MDFDWKEYLALAHSLERQSTSGLHEEAAGRSAVSRAYYAAFCHARNYARDRHGLRLTYTARDHALVQHHFHTRRVKGIALKLDLLRHWRNRCDYEDAVADLAIILSSALVEAQKIIAILK